MLAAHSVITSTGHADLTHNKSSRHLILLMNCRRKMRSSLRMMSQPFQKERKNSNNIGILNVTAKLLGVQKRNGLPRQENLSVRFVS